MAQVGYGDAVPITVLGKCVAACAMVVSVLIMALPISVIGTHFSNQWLEYKDVEQFKETNIGAPYFEKLTKDFKEHYFLMDDLAKKYAPHPPPAYHPSRPSRCSSNMDPTCLGSTWGRRGVRTASHTAATIRFTRSTHTGAVSPPEGGIESGPCALDGEGSGF